VKTKRLLKGALLTLAAFAGGAMMTAVGGHRAEATPRDTSPYAAIGQLGRVLVEIENDYVEPVDRTKLVNGAISGMVASLDPHSAYMPPQDFQVFESDTEGKFGGVGIEVEVRDETLVVMSPIEGSPAERAGILPGDRIVAIDGLDAIGAALDKVVRRMRGLAGTHVKLTVKRASAPQFLLFDLVREEIHVPSVSARMLDGDIAYVRVKQFQDHTHDELLAAAARLRKESNDHIAGVLLDLRNDPGGLVDESAEVADEFLSSGTIYTTRHRGEIVDDVRAKSGGAFSDVPVVALVNEYTASAAELVTGALQDNKRATVVGANTFGKGSVQAILGLPGGAGLRLTIARYYTPSGHAIQGDGVHPDVVVESTRVDAPAQPVMRERDLDGALAPEGAQKKDEKPKMPAAAGATSAAEETMRSDARNVPRDPKRGADFVLKMGYQILRARVALKP
jgi:carboxyl-terminal processing protease